MLLRSRSRTHQQHRPIVQTQNPRKGTSEEVHLIEPVFPVVLPAQRDGNNHVWGHSFSLFANQLAQALSKNHFPSGSIRSCFSSRMARASSPSYKPKLGARWNANLSCW